jgi:ubiquinone/menaquinone biosynthesis C-methylase UbiE
VSQVDRRRERLIEIYRHKAKHYDLTSRLYPAPGYPQRRQRLRAVGALGLRPGDFVIDMACGTGLNFPLIQEAIGPDGRIVGVDLTDAMLARAQERIATNGWRNVSLEQADAAEFEFPTGADAILSTYALTQVPDSTAVIAHGAAALSGGGRWVVLDLKVPGTTPRWLTQLGRAAVRRRRRVADAPPLGGDSQSNAGTTHRRLVERLVLRDRISRRGVAGLRNGCWIASGPRRRTVVAKPERLVLP